MDLEALDAWLEKLKPAAKVDGVSMLDGYLAGIIVGPRSVSPDEWFFDLLCARGNIGTAQGKTLKAIMAIVERFNAISETLSTAPQQYAPIFHRTDDGTVLPDHGAWGSLPPCNSDGLIGKLYATWTVSSMVCCSQFFCTAPTNSASHTSGHLDRDPIPLPFLKMLITTSHWSFQKSGSSIWKSASQKRERKSAARSIRLMQWGARIGYAEGLTDYLRAVSITVRQIREASYECLS